MIYNGSFVKVRLFYENRFTIRPFFHIFRIVFTFQCSSGRIPVIYRLYGLQFRKSIAHRLSESLSPLSMLMSIYSQISNPPTFS